MVTTTLLLVDDVSISTASPFDLTIAQANSIGGLLSDEYHYFQIGNNAVLLENQIKPEDFRFGANVKNLGFQNVVAADNATLNVNIQKDNGSAWTTVFQASTPIDSIDVFGNGTVVIDTIATQTWATVGNYRAIYSVNISGDVNSNNDSLISTFSISDNYLSKVDLSTSNSPSFNRPIFPGGTDFNKFEFGSYFSSPYGGSDFKRFDSIDYIFYVPSNYTGSGTQIVNSKIYEWTDGAGTGAADGIPNDLTSGEFNLVAEASDTLNGLVPSASYFNSKMNFYDVATNQAGYFLQDGKTYLITLQLLGTQFTSTSSIWFGASESRSYALNTITPGTLLSPSQIFLEDGSGNASSNWIGFGTDIIPSFGVHVSTNLPPVTSLVISEIMYNPPENGVDTTEYIEIYNPSNQTVNLNGYTFSQGVSHTFSNDTIGANDFVVLAVDSAAISHVFGYTKAIQWTTGGLSNSGEDITLVDPFNRTVDSVDYDDANIWLNPNSTGNPDGDGPSIELIDLNTDNNIGTNWMASLESTNYFVNAEEVKGSPGYFPIQIEFSSTSVSCNGNADGTAKVIASRGFPTYTYLWSNGMTTDSISNLGPATYTVSVTDNSGRTKVDSISITEPSALVASINLDSNVTCNGLSNGGATASAMGGTGAYTYLWSNNATTASITGISAGTYSVSITDNNGCVVTDQITITSNPLPTAEAGQNSSICLGSAISLGGSPTGPAGATYSWDNAASLSNNTVANPIASPTVTTIYTVTVTSSNGCSSTDQVTVTVNPLPIADAGLDQTICNGNMVVLGGSPSGPAGATYLWDNAASLNNATLANPTASPTVTTTYTLTVTDVNGCSNTDQSVITLSPVLIVNTTINDVSCNGGSDGSISVNSSGGTSPFSYLWSNGANTSTSTGLTANSYTVTVTDAIGCSNISIHTIAEPAPLVTTETIINASCNGATDGSISIITNGGTSPYTYSWSNGASTSTASGLAAASYSATITDANGCTSITSTVISEPAAIVNTVTQAGINLTADQNGATYQWLDCNNGNAILSGETAQTFVATANGSYAVEVTINNCVDTSACANVISVGLDQIEREQMDLTIFPNPTNGFVNIRISGSLFQNEQMRVFDLSGKVIRETTLTGNQVRFDLGEYDSGIYFIQIGSERRKLILTK